MASNFMIALLVAVGIGVWVYSKVMHSSGNNSQNALTVGGITAFVAFLLVMLVLGVVF